MTVRQKLRDAGTAVKGQVFNFIAGALFLLFAGTWTAVIVLVWTFTPTEADPLPVLGGGMVLAAGTLATALGTQTASSLGIAIGTVGQATPDTQITTAAVAANLPARTYVAVVLYVLVGLAVFFTWLLRESVSPELVSAFALSLLGWIIGAASTIFKAS